MPKKRDILGCVFGNLTVTEEAGRDSDGGVLWRCSCKCGRTSLVRLGSLTSGKTKSCGCGIKNAPRPKKHGMAGTGIYRVWAAMKKRCLNPNDASYKNYGGRGIKVCERWMSFLNFYADMGEPPQAGMDIDRRDNNGHYEPSNCRWVTRLVNANNCRSNVLVVVDGAKMSVSEAARAIGVRPNTLHRRIANGLDLSKALNTNSLKSRGAAGRFQKA